MHKFLSKDNFLISLDNIVLVDQTAATTTVIHYADGLIATITHGSLADPGFFTALVAVIKKALASEWTKPIYEVTDTEVTVTISGIAYTHVTIPTS